MSNKATHRPARIKMEAKSEISNSENLLTQAKIGDALCASLLEFATKFRPPPTPASPHNGLTSLVTTVSFTSTHLKHLHASLQLPVQVKIDVEFWEKVCKAVGETFKNVNESLKKAIQGLKEIEGTTPLRSNVGELQRL